MNLIDGEKLLAWLDGECSREEHLGKAHAIMRVMAKIRSGAFDIQPPKEQKPVHERAGRAGCAMTGRNGPPVRNGDMEGRGLVL